eukprot:scaffold1459_cov104-Isochrysis_galbana.AAC.7
MQVNIPLVGSNSFPKPEFLPRARAPSPSQSSFPKPEPLPKSTNGPCECVGVLADCQLRRRGAAGVVDAQHSTPLGEARPRLVVRTAPLSQVVHPLRHRLVQRAWERGRALVNLDAGQDALRVKQVDKPGVTVTAHVEQRLFETDRAGKVLAQARRGKEQLAVGPPVLVRVGDAKRRELASDGGRRLVGGEDALARCGDCACRRGELCSERAVLGSLKRHPAKAPCLFWGRGEGGSS